MDKAGATIHLDENLNDKEEGADACENNRIGGEGICDFSERSD